MTTATAPAKQQGAPLTMQGQLVPAESVNPDLFFQQTRRRRTPEYSRVYAGLGGTEFVELKKSDIIGALHVRFSGTLVVTHGTGSVAATFRWPYDLIKALKFTANGQSNLINVSGLKLKAREVMANPAFSDRGVAQSVSGSNTVQGTFALASELWGVGPGAAAIATGNYPVELYWKVPVAEDEKDLSGAIFAQTTSMDLTVQIDWEQLANLFTITGNDTVALNGNILVETEKYSIPSDNGAMVIPDLSLFHSLVQNRVGNGISQGDNEHRLMGQGPGKTLLRVFYEIWAGATPAPLAVTAANYGQQAWRYGSNETPESFPDGRSLREWDEQLYSCDIGAVWGFLSHEFETTWGFRDDVDMGQTAELRLLINLASSPVSPALEVVQETMYAAGTAA